ncbi:hypothetical protein DWB77_00555 [Streptomyces hundungensis]|uniref:NAD(P)-binding domain-containing protein n=1 Tax=Streptomyces hundungensis TaxID=1077946 RepID=A0A387HCS5_9ACTN|nr:NAD(P)H-binding protein [Streptomyces hundungensis]AYG78448.1 hypothetical protein DWB77_00555 [Streptomyces hundungensis]
MARIAVASSWFKLSTGRIVAEQATARGHDVRPLTDIEDPDSLRAALTDTDAVILVPKRGDALRHTEQATTALLREAERSASAPHIILLSSFAVGHGPAHPLNRTATSLLPSRVAAEQAVRDSHLPHTIVRATWMTDDPQGSHALTFTQDAYADGMVARADIAAAIVAAVEEPAARGTTFALFNEPGAPPRDWHTAFAALRRDTDAPAHHL